ncbi:hypothetical protein ACFQ1E_07940 [Sphingomonas canadensis]|uniref:Phage tail tape measure protein n=2 Tax=Sphingomonas canadensis TaxID=1219257 RepID=A0ABW3H5W9_9SPHN|nr:hypothetical protein [Sphingomonas canadensis]
MDGATRSAARLERAGYRMGHAIGSGARRGVAGLIALERRLTITSAQAERMGRWAGGKVAGGIQMAGMLGTAAVAAAGWKVVSAGTTFELIETQLEGLEGSSAKAAKSMEWIKKFASQTPMELADVAEAFIFARNNGIDPTNGSLRILGDSAKALNKTFEDSIGMLSDAMRDQFDRLPEFGINAERKGAQVIFSYVDKAGKQAVAKVKKDSFAIRDALLGIFDAKFGGGMERAARTTAGKWSNTMDRLTVTADRVWRGGIAQAVNRALDEINSDLDENSAETEKWAAEVGGYIGSVIDRMREIDWKGVTREVASAVATMAQWTKPDPIGSGFSALIRRNQQAALSMSLRNPFLSDETKYRQLWQLRALNKQLGWDEWTSVSLMMKEAARRREIRDAEKLRRQHNQPKGNPRLLPNVYSVPDFRRGPAPPAPPPPKGTISLKVEPAPGLIVTPVGISASGVKLNVLTGRTMVGV